MTNTADSNDSYDLFMGALDVTNRAIDEMREKPVIKDLVGLMEKQASGRKFGVAVYSDDPDNVYDYYTVRVQNHTVQLVSRGKDTPDIDWKVSREYLKDVNDDPQAYIDNPLKLDLEWIKHRTSDAA